MSCELGTVQFGHTGKSRGLWVSCDSDCSAQLTRLALCSAASDCDNLLRGLLGGSCSLGHSLVAALWIMHILSAVCKKYAQE